MKKSFFFLLLSFCVQINAQSLKDAHRYSQNGLEGSARYTAMGGAFGAVGGDFSAFDINPAGAAVFAFNEIGGSFNFVSSNNEATYFNTTAKEQANDLAIGHLGAVFVLNDESGGGWSKISVGFNYNKSVNYDNSFSAQGYNPSRGIDQYFLSFAQGKELVNISQINDENFNEAYRNIGGDPDLGFPAQQALFGYEGFVINPIPLEGSDDPTDDNIREYRSNTEAGAQGYFHEYIHSSLGQSKRYTINISGVFQDKFHLGFNINHYNIEYSELVDFSESNYSSASGIRDLNFRNELITVGRGNSFQLGAIYKLNPQFRLGLSFESPTYYRLSDRIRQSLVTEAVDENGAFTLELDPAEDGSETFFPEYQFNSAGSVRGSLAYIYKDKGIISLDYTLRDFSAAQFTPKDDVLFRSLNQQIEGDFQASQQLQLGAEYRLNPFFSLRAGYWTQSATKLFVDNSLEIISGGAGFNFGPSNLDVALQLRSATESQMLFANGLTDRIGLNRDDFNLVFTYRFKL